MRCPPRALTTVLAATVLVACASPKPKGGIGPERYDSLQGQSGPVEWEVKNLRQTREEGGRQVTWWYDLILRNAGSAAIDFQREDVSMIADDGSFGGHGTQAFVLRLKAGDDAPVGRRTFSFHCRNCDPLTAEATFRRGIVRIHDFVGKDEQGSTIHAVLRIRLDNSSGPVLR